MKMYSLRELKQVSALMKEINCISARNNQNLYTGANSYLMLHKRFFLSKTTWASVFSQKIALWVNIRHVVGFDRHHTCCIPHSMQRWIDWIFYKSNALLRWIRYVTMRCTQKMTLNYHHSEDTLTQGIALKVADSGFVLMYEGSAEEALKLLEIWT